LAGIWESDLPLSLIWMQIPPNFGPAETGPGLDMKYAPSWSWASVMVSICHANIFPITDIPHVVHTEVVDIKVERISQNYFDDTNLCRLRLRGPMCKFCQPLQDDSPYIQIPGGDAFQDTRDLDFSREGRGRHIILYWDKRRSFKADKYFLLHIVTTADEDENYERGLVLLRINARGTYKRIGAFIIPKSSGYTGSKLEDAFKGDFGTLSTEDHLELESDGKYTINIIRL
jgi:hypothetical protein